jgi:hypothetical protein
VKYTFQIVVELNTFSVAFEGNDTTRFKALRRSRPAISAGTTDARAEGVVMKVQDDEVTAF